MRYRAGVRKPQTRFFEGRSLVSGCTSATSVTAPMATTVAERAANGKVFSCLFSGTGARARALPRQRARTVTERRELERVGSPLGGGRACGGLPELAQGWRERRRRQSLHNLLCKSGSEGSPSGATLAARVLSFLSRCLGCKGRDRRATADKTRFYRPCRAERLWRRRSDRSPGAGGGDPEHGRAGGTGTDLAPGTAVLLHVHLSDGAGLAASCEGRDGAPWDGQGLPFVTGRSSILGHTCGRIRLSHWPARRSAGWQRACTACSWVMLTSV